MELTIWLLLDTSDRCIPSDLPFPSIQYHIVSLQLTVLKKREYDHRFLSVGLSGATT